MDLQQGNGVSTIASYVAVMRVKTRKDLLIYRPFKREVFNRGAPRGATLLLKKLRCEHIDWANIARQMQPRKPCHRCEIAKVQEEFSATEWRTKGDICCKECIKGMEEAGTPYLCSRCMQWKAAQKYSVHNLRRGKNRLCVDCVGKETRECCRCARKLMWVAFGKMWNEEDEGRCCVKCQVALGMVEKRTCRTFKKQTSFR